MDLHCCTLCPRACGIDRTQAHGFCGAPSAPKLARAALHHWEEPCLSGTRGSGTVFFSHCALGCCFCQNYTISAEGFGKTVSVPRLAEIFLALQAQGAHNINLVSATPYVPFVLEALALTKPALQIPIVYNTSGYESAQTLALLADAVDIWLTDLKFCSSELSAEYANAPDYFAYALGAAQTMIAQAGPPVFDTEGMLQRGVIVRHLALPCHTADSLAVLEAMAQKLPQEQFLTSIMSQYTPFYKAKAHPKLRRRISSYEYNKAIDAAVSLGLTSGYMQEKSSAKEEYTPLFDLTGIT